MEEHNDDDDDMDDLRQNRLDSVAKIAVQIEKNTLVPPQLLIAQWALESEWGAKPAGNHNYFGMKKSDRHTQCCSVPTHEAFTKAQIDVWNVEHPNAHAKVIKPLGNGKFLVEIQAQFADYNSLQESCEDYAFEITHGTPYAHAWARYLQNKRLIGINPPGLLYNIAHVYATDPHYYILISQIAQQPAVVQAINTARALAK